MPLVTKTMVSGFQLLSCNIKHLGKILEPTLNWTLRRLRAMKSCVAFYACKKTFGRGAY